MSVTIAGPPTASIFGNNYEIDTLEVLEKIDFSVVPAVVTLPKEFAIFIHINKYFFTLISTPGRNKLMKNADLAQLPADFGVMDYLTNQQDDYRNPYPAVTKPVCSPLIKLLYHFFTLPPDLHNILCFINTYYKCRIFFSWLCHLHPGY